MKIADPLLVREFQLLPEETVLTKADFVLLKFPSPDGTLFLTEIRLVWIRSRLVFSWRSPAILEIPLHEVRQCQVRRSVWWSWRRALVIEYGSGQAVRFWPNSGTDAREWAQAIRDLVALQSSPV